MKTYRPKALVDGSRIGEQAGTSWVAVPDKLAGTQIEVIYANTRMVIKDWRKEAQQFKRFRDKFWTADSGRPQHYTLGYFKYVPEVDNAHQ